MTLTDPKAYTGTWGGKKAKEADQHFTANSEGLWGKRPDGTAYGDMREEYCVYSVERRFWEDAPGGTGWKRQEVKAGVLLHTRAHRVALENLKRRER